MKRINSRKFLKVIEVTVVGFATWLNPQAGILLALLKLCFQILEVLEEENHKAKEDEEAEKSTSPS